jgi:hypothetical protein
VNKSKIHTLVYNAIVNIAHSNEEDEITALLTGALGSQRMRSVRNAIIQKSLEEDKIYQIGKNAIELNKNKK